MEQNSNYTWEQVRAAYPHKFVVFQAIKSHSTNNKRVVDAINVINSFDDGEKAMREYLRLHREDRKKELYVVHTDKQQLDITEKKWLGIRMA
ncbi:MAG: hypothetical protein IT291_03130 [Deltaproteobacteria bacterium]|nr:hypothetical protein [Deltaproteobacteria bacterium]